MKTKGDGHLERGVSTLADTTENPRRMGTEREPLCLSRSSLVIFEKLVLKE